MTRKLHTTHIILRIIIYYFEWKKGCLWFFKSLHSLLELVDVRKLLRKEKW